MSGRASVVLLVIAMVSLHAVENRTRQIARHVGASRTPTTTCSKISIAPQSHAAARTPLQLISHQRSPTVALARFAFIIMQPPHRLDIQREYTTPPATAPAGWLSIDRRCGRSPKANVTRRDSKREAIYYEPTTDPDSCPFYYRSLVHPFDCIYSSLPMNYKLRTNYTSSFVS